MGFRRNDSRSLRRRRHAVCEFAFDVPQSCVETTHKIAERNRHNQRDDGNDRKGQCGEQQDGQQVEIEHRSRVAQNRRGGLYGTAVPNESFKLACSPSRRSSLVGEELLDAFEISSLRGLGGPRLEVVALQRRRYGGRSAEETPSFRNFKSGKAGGLEKSSLAVGNFDQLFQFRRRFSRQAEAPMNSREQALLDRLIGVADHRFERRNHVADDVFGRVVQQDRQTARVVKLRRVCACQRFDQERMLRHGKDVRAMRLAIPARDARKPVRDILDFDVERRWIEQIEPPPRQHSLPGARRICGSCLCHVGSRLACSRLFASG